MNLLRAQVAFASGHTSAPGGCPPPEPLDLEVARDTYLEAIVAGMFAGVRRRSARLAGWRAPPGRGAPDPRKRDLLLETPRHCSPTDIRRRGWPGRRSRPSADGPRISDDSRWLWVASLLAVNLWDYESWETLTGRHVRSPASSAISPSSRSSSTTGSP